MGALRCCPDLWVLHPRVLAPVLSSHGRIPQTPIHPLSWALWALHILDGSSLVGSWARFFRQFSS
eukprot:scaffold626_cov337-Pavlova_lutheri.AAC.32